MKNYKNCFLLILLTLSVVLLLTSCPDSVLTSVNNIDEMPNSIKTVEYLNYSAANGTVSITDTTITVTSGSSPGENITDALELNTSLALAASYTIEDEYVPGDSEDSSDGGVYTLTYTKDSYPTIEYEFGICINCDVMITKKVNDIEDEDFLVFFTWDNLD